ncbi:helix-turn-helix domain-containing protein [Ferriphaselus sp. R-1]|uniref:helix-turn-helix domain-containing protein n=1 Tax=Ferriphaselus sp. R-1 TaxID=1485544 RepID=UPI000558B9A6|nr:helix-turn-helix domain-containing protein [Ferriphaselus sp. R-1]
MSHALTAEDLYSEMKRMPAGERIKFFTLLTGNAFREDDFTHEQVFGQLHQEMFSAWEAAEYLEISVPTLRRYVQSGKLVPSQMVGRNQMFSTQSLRAFKRSRGRT